MVIVIALGSCILVLAIILFIVYKDAFMSQKPFPKRPSLKQRNYNMRLSLFAQKVILLRIKYKMHQKFGVKVGKTKYFKDIAKS
jgi:hypothetical protein